MPVTLREIAREAGVSPATVSKALHGGDERVRVAPSRVLEIQRIAKRLNYYPNAHARSLRGNRTQTIGLVFEKYFKIGAGPAYCAELLDGIVQELFPRHYRLTILPEVDHKDLIGSIADGRLDGVLWAKLRAGEARSLAKECPIPIVAVSGVPDIASVSCDNAGGMELAVAHLWELGHRHIAFVHESNESLTLDCMARRDGFQEAVRRRDGLTGDVLVWEWQLNEFREWFRASNQATALVFWSERGAGVMLEIAEREGISIPEELSVIGFDSTTYCELTRPRLTAVRQPIREMAECATRLLVDAIERGDTQVSPPSSPLPCALDLRASTAPPRPH
ncbi:MAG: hypothetical protein C4320_03230 [Armatimonadota bacterium]